MQDVERRNASRAVVSCLALVSLAHPGVAAPRGREAAARLTATALVANSSERAAEKLRRPECRQVLTDFRDGFGRRLSEVLEERGVAAPDYVRTLVFVDGRSVPRCATGTVAAGANVGSPVIAVCKGTFARVESDDPGLAANVLIHEMLHALGLGEDPPTSEEITQQVAKRCGR